MGFRAIPPTQDLAAIKETVEKLAASACQQYQGEGGGGGGTPRPAMSCKWLSDTDIVVYQNELPFYIFSIVENDGEYENKPLGLRYVEGGYVADVTAKEA